MVSERLSDSRRPSLAGIEAAAKRLAGVVSRTPLLPVSGWNGRLWIKAESLQIGGAFKLRGAYNRLVQVPEDRRPAGAVAFSSGNHAQGVARAARMLEMPAWIVMPADAPAVKLAATRAQGAEIVLYDRRREDRQAIASAIAEQRGAVLVPPYEHVDVIEGQGTAGLEIAEQLGHAPARVLAPCGGGGLTSGLALALPDTQVFAVEPAGWDDMGRSLELGHIVEVPEDAPSTLCDALQPRRVGDMTFGALRAAGGRGLSVNDDQVRTAMRFAFDLGLVVEPGGSAALAAWLAGLVADEGGDTVIVCSGSNVDPVAFAGVIGGSPFRTTSGEAEPGEAPSRRIIPVLRDGPSTSSGPPQDERAG